MNKLLHIIPFLVAPLALNGQASDTALTLNEVYHRISSNYPLMEKMELQKKINLLNDQILRSGHYPEIQLQGSASYQSEVTEIPFTTPGTVAPQLSRDHYNISVNISQSIYDGGFINARRKLESGQSEVENARVQASIWEVRLQAEQVFFGILSLQKRMESVNLLSEDVEEQLSSVQAKIEQGVLLPGNGKVLEAELLKIRQQIIQIEYEIKAGFEVLSELTGQKIEKHVKLKIPKTDDLIGVQDEISRPEIRVFEEQIDMLHLQQEVTSADRLPKVSAFAKGAYGRPGYDVFNDDLHPFWMVGIRAQWSFRNWSNAGHKEEVLELQKKNKG